MSASDESAVRKAIWTRKDAVDAKMAEPGFEALPEDERDAWVVSLQLGVPFGTAARFLGGTASADELAQVRTAAEETFRFGKRKALRPLKEALARHGTRPADEEAEA